MIPTDDINLVLTSKRDSLFENGPFPVPFEFNHEVVEVFDDMVSRSVPLYKEVNEAIVQWSYLFHQNSTNIYDIGCSTGTTLHAIAQHLPLPAKLIGIDNSGPMIKKAKAKLSNIPDKHSSELVLGNALDVSMENSSLTILNYTLQFFPLKERKKLLQKIFDATVSEGILFMSEKVRSENPYFQDAITRIYENFKIKAGYSKNEVERKKEALDRVLVPLSLNELIDMLKEVGFKHVEPIIRWNTFVSIVAQKD